jgi:hypothetical protein
VSEASETIAAMDEDLELEISYTRLLDAARAMGKAARLPVEPQLADRRLAYVDACLGYHGYEAAIAQEHHL